MVVTDRVELDDQIAKTFAACGAVSDANQCHASSGAHLRELLSGNHRYVFTLIQKFQTPEILCDRRDVIVLTDEAHRSQYDALALNMRGALPQALFLAFTGTPLIAGEERTREVFGDYVSIYDFQQSVEDGATVPLYYENRTPELRLENPDLNDDLYALIEAEDLDEAQEERLERELGRQYHLIPATIVKSTIHCTGQFLLIPFLTVYHNLHQAVKTSIDCDIEHGGPWAKLGHFQGLAALHPSFHFKKLTVSDKCGDFLCAWRQFDPASWHVSIYNRCEKEFHLLRAFLKPNEFAAIMRERFVKVSEKLSEKRTAKVDEIRRRVSVNRLALPSDISYKYL